MAYKILFTPDFEKHFKRLCKKYKSLPTDLAALVDELKTNPVTGVSLGNNCYKVRLAIKSKGKGKSGGARIITFVLINDNEVYLVAIYDKSEQETIPQKEILRITKAVKK